MSLLSTMSRRGVRFSLRSMLARPVSGWASSPLDYSTFNSLWIWCSASRTRHANGTQSVRTVRWSTVMYVLLRARRAVTHAPPDITQNLKVASVRIQVVGSNTVESARSRAFGDATNAKKVTTSISYSATARATPAQQTFAKTVSFPALIAVMSARRALSSTERLVCARTLYARKNYAMTVAYLASSNVTGVARVTIGTYGTSNATI